MNTGIVLELNDTIKILQERLKQKDKLLREATGLLARADEQLADKQKLMQQWDAVQQALSEVSPNWSTRHPSPTKSACLEIEALAKAARDKGMVSQQSVKPLDCYGNELHVGDVVVRVKSLGSRFSQNQSYTVKGIMDNHIAVGVKDSCGYDYWLAEFFRKVDNTAIRVQSLIVCDGFDPALTHQYLVGPESAA